MEETEVGASFPVKGIDVTCEFMRQPEDTTPDAENVRTHDTLAERARGGSRPGLSKYIPEQVHLEHYQVQHLNVLVDPQQPSLSGTFEIDDPSTTVGPYRVPGRKIRNKGNGRRPKVPDAGSPDPVAFVQKHRVQPGTISTPTTVTMPSPTIVDDVLFVIIRTELAGGAEALVDTVRNGAGIDFHKAGPSGNETSTVTGDTGGGTTTYSLSVWYKACDNADDNTIVVTPGASAVYEIVVLEYSNAATDGPVSNTSKGSDPTNSFTWTLADLELNDTEGQLVIAAFVSINTIFDSAGGYTERYGTPSSDPANIVVTEKSHLSGVGPENPTVTVIILPRPWCGIAVAITNQ